MGIFKHWITDGSGHPFYARKRFSLKDHVETAEAFVCGLGQFNLYINGQEASDHRLDPAWTDYRKTVSYVRFDLTPFVHPGENVLAAEVGNGWYLMDETGYSFRFPGFMPENPNGYKPFGLDLKLAGVIRVKYWNGREEEISFNEETLTAPHPVQHTNVFGSEVTDGRMVIPGWNEVSLDDSGWQKAEIVEKSHEPKGRPFEETMPPIRVRESLKGQLTGKVNGRLIYDFGRNSAAMLKAKVKGHKGSNVIFRPAEKLKADGDIDQMAKNWMLIDVFESYTFGKEQEFEDFRMVFTYFGGRYVSVEGVSEEDIADVEAEVITSAIEDAGSFTCDDERFLKIYDLVKHSVESNMLSVHTDCPTIERFAWQEENVMMAPSVMYMKEVAEHWRKFLRDARDEQHKAADFFLDYEGNKIFPGYGLIPSQAPCYIPNVVPVPGMGSFYDIIPWGSSIVLGLYWHYMFYGNKKIIEENYEAAKHYLSHLERKIDGNGFISHGLGDWGNSKKEFARENIETAFFYWDNKVMSFLAHENGRMIDELRFMARAESIRQHYNRILLKKDPKSGRYGYTTFDVLVPGEDNFHTTQAALALPLYLNMVPEEYKQDVVEMFREKMQEDGSFITGEVGQAYIIQTMAAYGMNDLICEFILEEEHPSYYAFIKDGETTLGEFWEKNPRSHNHDMMGHIIEWYYNGLAGIKAVRPGFKEVVIRPYLPKSMDHLEASYKTPYGQIRVELKRTDEGIELITEVPDNIIYTIDRSDLEA